MKHIIYNKDKMIFRHSAGVPVYSERFENGALIMESFRRHGIPLQDRCVSKNRRPCPSFNIEVNGCDMRYGWKISDFAESTENDGRAKSELTLVSENNDLILRIVTLCGENGMLTRKLYLKNTTDKPMTISKAAPLCGVLWEESDTASEYVNGYDDVLFSVGGFAGCQWGMEGVFEWNDIPLNRKISFGSNNGKSGHGNPFAIVKNKVFGGYFICQLEWSTEWSFTFGSEYWYYAGDSRREFRLTYSLEPSTEKPMRVLEAGEELALPTVHFGLFNENFDFAIQALQNYQRKYIIAKPYGGKELSSYDGWGFHGSDYREDIFYKEIDRAAELGMEMYTVDAGWYGKAGTGWIETVGDWNSCRLPNDLTPIIDYVHKKGMKFGLWVEPESVGKESQLAKEHPEYFASYHGKTVERWIDLSNPKVEKWVEDQLFDIISRYDIDLLRLDYNNPTVNGTRKNGNVEENILWRYTEALYRIFDRIHEKFPNLMLENCASGGGRTDLGMMKRFSKTQFSDWYRLPRGVRTLNGMSMCLPPECLLLQYGTALDSNNTGSAEMQIQMLMLGVPKISGIAPIEEEVSPWLFDTIKKYLNIYYDFIRPMQRDSLVYHHTPEIKGNAGRGWTALEFASPDKAKSYNFIARLPETDENSFCFKPKGLSMGNTYEVTYCTTGEKVILSGYELMKNGIEIVCDTPLNSELLLIKKESRQ